MDTAKCFDCIDWCGTCVSDKRAKRLRLGRIASSDACDSFRPKRKTSSSQEVQV
jgi:hypothetical protein